MAERTSRKIPVTERQFLWVQDDDKGEVVLHVGPTMVSPTAADRVVIDDGAGGFVEDVSGQPQRMIEVGDTQYAVITNPLVEGADPAFPNGKFKAGRNEARPLRNGTRAMLPGPTSFYLRPGQQCEVRDAHELASNQYLVVKVYGEVDAAAPYHDITVRSAAITTFTAEPLGAAQATAAGAAGPAPAALRRGQLIVIRGLDTQLYIPPTGVDIVPDTTVDGAAVGADAARQLLAQLRAAPPPPAPAPALAAEELQDDETPAPQQKAAPPGRAARRDAYVEQAARTRHRVGGGGAAGPAPQQQLVQALMHQPEVRRALEREARQARLVREAVVLGEKEYCVVIDADGKRNVRRGPARVFPGPYDTFMSEGSRERVYDAYELLPTRALWLRVITPIGREELQRRLPPGFQLERPRYEPGDEILLTGVSTFFFPFNEIEVLSPVTGLAVVGNDHSKVFIEAIGIDQKSGIYVRDLTTGEARLVRGKTSYLVHPGKEVHITRTVPAEDWNRWVAPGEPHKEAPAPVTTPWALSIVVPHNQACMATSASGHRVIEGPCVELLEYEETLTALSLSTGTPKSDDATIRTCFLRTVGNRVSDVIRVQSADFVEIDVRVSCNVTFIPEWKDRWFNHENYVQVLCEHLRSLVRSRCRALQLAELWPQLTSVIRDVVLGDRVEGEGRPGRLFKDNGMLVTEVEVLTAEILDPQIAALYHSVQRQIVSLQIGDREAQAQLASSRLRDEVEKERQALERAAAQRAAALKDVVRGLAQQAALAEVENGAQVAIARAEADGAREMATTKAALARQQEQQAVERDLRARRAEAEAAARRLEEAQALEAEAARHKLRVQLIEARSAASVAERQAVQRHLVEALTALGDKALLTEAARNMNLVSLFKGKDVMTLLGEVLNGTRVMDTVRKLQETHGGPPQGG
ncbi:MAG: hypothetical protein KF878_12870 [Planctomycetes bacterium]|nr:hypothetical protein [Planctomycetota bacterium]